MPPRNARGQPDNEKSRPGGGFFLHLAERGTAIDPSKEIQWHRK